jgi:hypothetical protein
VFASDPPRVKVPDGNVSVPAETVKEPRAVTFPSRNEKLPLPVKSRLLNELLVSITFEPLAINFTVPLLCVKVPPEFVNVSPIVKVALGSVTFP